MTTMHTGGPWPMRESATHVTVTNARGDAVFHDDKRIPGVMADARLIAAAPDLLEALQNIAEYWNQDQNEAAMADACWHAIHTARAAIARATGEQP